MSGRIVRAAIHPGVGLARMGNSKEYFLAPQVMTPEPQPEGFYHTQEGQLKREAAEFRIYGYDGAGNVVAELTPQNADIKWTVELAAMKGHWYKFRAAQDIKGAEDFRLQRRNPNYDPAKREDLAIRPGPVSIAGTNADSGMFGAEFIYEDTKTPVQIGELRTDEVGRLIVLSGFGVSGNPTGLPIYDANAEDGFGNPDGWYDEACDGPVTASVTIGGEEIPCEGAWAVIAPPNYAPEIIGWRSMLDLLEEVWQDAGWMAAPDTVSFTRDIYPLLGRLSDLQWVNQGFISFFGQGAPLDFKDEAFIKKIATVHEPGDIYKQLRQELFTMFRPISGDGVSLRSQPWIYGDAFGTLPASDPLNGLPLWPAAAEKMRKWVAGDFDADWGKVPAGPTSIDKVALADQPEMLDKTPLHFCLADAFHPGCELTWPMRHSSLWEKPYRVRRRAPGSPEPDYGPHLTTEVALGPNGPLHGQSPGNLTRWMALPWQADTAMCRSGYELKYDPYLPTFWPARVPNQVFTKANYEIVTNPSLPAGERLQAFFDRDSWYDTLAQYGNDDMMLMVQHFAEMGVVERREWKSDLPEVPDVLFVAVSPEMPAGLLKAADQTLVEGVTMHATESEADAAAIKAGWLNEEHRQYARSVKMAIRLKEDTTEVG